MASTISINFATEQEVYLEYPPAKKSVSAKLLSDVLGGGIVSGGYVKRTGDSMTGYLSLTSVPPTNPLHAATKQYVDDHSYTRRYFYECKNSNQIGCVKPGSLVLSGFDLNTNLLKFFDKGTGSLNNISRYMDVYRNGILQVFGQDYKIINVSTQFSGTTAIQFFEPFQDGATFQVSIGNVGAFPTTFGTWNVYGSEFGGFGIRTSATSGDVTLFVTPSSFTASNQEVNQGTINDRFLTPRNLSAARISNKAWGLFRKQIVPTEWDRDAAFGGGNPNPPYGSSTGTFFPVVSCNISQIRNIGAFENPVALNKFRVYLNNNCVPTTDYVTQISTNTNNTIDALDLVFTSVIGSTRTLSSFDFFVYDFSTDNPRDIYEFNVTVN